METLPFSAASSKSISSPEYISSSMDYRYRAGDRSRLFFVLTTPRLVHSRRRNLSIKNVASDQRQEREPTDSVASGGHFDLPKAFFATAESVWDSLIINWNATQEYYEKMNVKQGRALLNAVGNLELSGAYGEALRKLGHNLEDVAGQEQDAALGNGGLGWLASCFLDSLATLNYPALGYRLRYKYGLLKQLITKDGQEEVAESWLEIGNPWEIVRNDVFYPVKFYGEFISRPDGSKEWVGGENVTAIAHEVPLPGYKTKTKVNLQLWSTKVAPEEFDLHAFNSEDHAKAYAALKNAEKICYTLYHGEESLEGFNMEGSSEYHSKLIHTIIEEYGTEDLDLLQQKMKQMRILDYVELPNSAVELLVQSEENSAIDSIQEIDIANEDNDPDIGVLLKVVFSPDYNVSVAEVLILGSELSQHISTAGMKASGTSNKKFAMNGCVLVGTLDGANVEIKQEVGEENFFPSGTRADEIDDLRKERAEGKFVPDFREVKAFVRSGVFGQYSYDELMGSSEGNEGYGRTDYFLVAKDFPASQEEVGEAYRDQKVIIICYLKAYKPFCFLSKVHSNPKIKRYTKHLFFKLNAHKKG